MTDCLSEATDGSAMGLRCSRTVCLLTLREKSTTLCLTAALAHLHQDRSALDRSIGANERREA